MPANTYKIYYATLHLAEEKSADVARQITVIFDIPFYCSSGLNSGMPKTWLPFLGIQPYNTQAVTEKPLMYGVVAKVRTGSERGWFRKPRDVGIKDVNFTEEFQKKFPLPGEGAYSRFTTMKCMLISAALGGGIWDTPEGQKLSAYLKSIFSTFFENYKLTLTDSKRHINRLEQGIGEVSARAIARMVEINKLLEGKSGNDLSFNFSVEKWVTIFGDIRPILTPNNYPISIKPWERKIEDFFRKQIATREAKRLLDKYTFYIPGSQTLAELGLTEDQFKEVLGLIEREPNWSTLLSVTYAQIKVLFLDSGHIVIHPEDNYINLSSTASKPIIKAYCITLGEAVAIKVKADSTPYLNPGILAQNNPCGIMPTIGTCVMTPQDGIYVTLLVSPIYPYNLTDVINSNKLSLAASQKIFAILLQGLCNIHKTSVEFKPHIRAKLSHCDIKPDNIFVKLKSGNLENMVSYSLQPDQFEVCIADLDSIGMFDQLFYTRGYLSPEMARVHLAIKSGVAEAVPEDKIAYGRAYDVWAMGLTLAKVLQINNNPNGVFNRYPYLLFILTCQNMDQTYLHQVAGLEQSTIDAELSSIKEALPNTRDGRKLRSLWDIVHSMLQVAPDKRPNIFDIINNFRVQMICSEEVIFRQRTIPDYFQKPKPGKRQRTLEECFAKLQLKG